MKKGRVKASCGHWLKDYENLGKPVIYEDMARDGSPAICYANFCTKCYRRYMREGKLITKELADKLLEEYTTMRNMLHEDSR